jgi:hypothetical protein
MFDVVIPLIGFNPSGGVRMVIHVANALAARGGMLMKLPRLLGGNTTKGVEYLERSVTLDDTAVGKRLELAEAYHIVGREDDANTAAQHALETAQKLNDPQRVATCERFIVELKKTCGGWART